MTSSNGNVFRVTGHLCGEFTAWLAICAGNSPGAGEFPAQRPMTRSFDVFCDLRLNKRLSKQSWGWWFETLSRPLWHRCHEWLTKSRTWIRDYIIGFVWNVITHACPNFNSGLTEPTLKLTSAAWKSPNGNIFRATGPLWGESSGLQWRGALMFSLTCASTNGWWDTGD